MLSLKGRQDGFRLLIPKEFIPDEVNEKYSKILREQRGFINKPIDFLNETIQKIEVLGFDNAVINQQQPGYGEPIMDPNRAKENRFPHGASETYYRSPANPLSLIDKSINVTFKHTLGYLNYFIIFESFLYHYSRDMKYKELIPEMVVELLNEKGSIYAKLVLKHPIINGIDMLSFDYTQPIAQSQTFQVVFKYSNFDYQFVQQLESNRNGEVE